MIILHKSNLKPLHIYSKLKVYERWYYNDKLINTLYYVYVVDMKSENKMPSFTLNLFIERFLTEI